MTCARLALVMLAASVGGCGFDGEIVLSVTSDVPIALQSSIDIALATPADSNPIPSICVCLANCPAGVVQRLLPLSASLRPGSQGGLAFRVLARGYANPDCTQPTVQAKAKVRFIDRQSRELRLRLAQACIGVVCQDPSTQTCNPDTGACEDDTVGELPSVDPRYDASVPDGADLSAPPDAAGSDLPLVPSTSFLITSEPASAIAVTAIASGFRVGWLVGDPTGRELHLATVDLTGAVGNPVVEPLAPGLDEYQYEGLCAAYTSGQELYGTAGIYVPNPNKSVMRGYVSSAINAADLTGQVAGPIGVSCAAGLGSRALSYVTIAVGKSSTTYEAHIGISTLQFGLPFEDGIVDSATLMSVSSLQPGSAAMQRVGTPLIDPLVLFSWFRLTQSNPAPELHFLVGDSGVVLMGGQDSQQVMENEGTAVAAARGIGAFALALQVSSPISGRSQLAIQILPDGATTLTPPVAFKTGLGMPLVQGGLALAHSGSGYIVAWIDGTELDVLRLDATGAGTNVAQQISTQAIAVGLADDGAGNVLLVWQDPAVPANGTSDVIRGQLFAPNP